MKVKRKKPFRLSLRYKVTIPVLVFVALMLFFILHTTFELVRGLMIRGVEERLLAVTDVFCETLKAPMLLNDPKDLEQILDWMGAQPNVRDVRLEDWKSNMTGSVNPEVAFPPAVLKKDFSGVIRTTEDSFVVSKPIQVEDEILGRVQILFSGLHLEEELQVIFRERILMGAVFVGILSLVILAVTWLSIFPIHKLENVAHQILAGHMDARVKIHTLDELQDLGEAFNQMLERLATSLERLRLRTEALEESEGKYRAIVDNVNEVIFTLSPGGQVVFLNEGFCGCKKTEFLQVGVGLILSLLAPESRDKFQETLRQVVREKLSVPNITLVAYERPSSMELYFLTNFTPILGPSGQVSLIQCVMRDITELRRFEGMKESLIRDVAHELKTPTAKFEMAVSWFERELQKSPEIFKYRELLEILKNNVDRLMRTITSIMDLSKLESGVDKIEKEDVDLKPLLDQICKDMAPLAHKKGLKLDYVPSEVELPMWGDSNMLYRLYVNLIQNAIKFTPGGLIQVKSHLVGEKVRVEVRDTGIGIAAEDLERIFERFVQKTAASSGIGVGLTLSRDIAKLHQGTIWAESQGVGRGSVFITEFPLKTN
ncbi:MAG: ATP-binding protein [Candidatus Omnitrophota bacterium]